MQTIFVDVDDVLNDLVSWWLAQYNRDYEDAVTRDMITSWEITKFVKCGSAFYRYLSDPKMFEAFTPKEGSREVIAALRKKANVYALSSCVIGSTDAKMLWVKENYGLPVIACGHKWLLKGDLLIDDGVHNAIGFEGDFWLFDTPWNRDNTELKRVYDWYEIGERLL